MLLAHMTGEGVPSAKPGSTINAAVISVFSTGFYVRAENDIFAIGGPQIPAGPIHLILSAPPPHPPEGSQVTIHPQEIKTVSGVINLSASERFIPNQPTQIDLKLIAPLLARFISADYFPDDIQSVVPDLNLAIEQRDLNSAQRLLEGRGGGLTPSGDDVLAGLLLYAAWARPAFFGNHQNVECAKTTDLSRAFLKWAVRGKSIAPVHNMITACKRVAGPGSDGNDQIKHIELNTAIRAVSSVGHSSGRGLLAGLGLATQWSV